MSHISTQPSHLSYRTSTCSLLRGDTDSFNNISIFQSVATQGLIATNLLHHALDGHPEAEHDGQENENDDSENNKEDQDQPQQHTSFHSHCEERRMLIEYLLT